MGRDDNPDFVKFSDEEKEKQYVLQKINHNVFKNPYDVMENISRVTNHIKNEIKKNDESSARQVLKFYSTLEGIYCYKDDFGDYWRVYKFVNNAITFDQTSDLKILEETGKAFGKFRSCLSGFFPFVAYLYRHFLLYLTKFY